MAAKIRKNNKRRAGTSAAILFLVAVLAVGILSKAQDRRETTDGGHNNPAPAVTTVALEEQQ
jgi:hypothetical protein